MKKTISLILCAVILCVSFAACGKETQAPPLNELYAQLEQVANMPPLYVMGESFIETMFGFDISTFEEYVFAEAEDASVYADAVILVKLADGADVNAVCETLEVYLNGVRENTKSYSPENYAKAEQSSVCVSGDYVYLVITEQYDEAMQIIANALK